MAKTSKPKLIDYRNDYAFAMSHAVSIDSSASVLNMIPIACFAALVILVVRMHTYYRPMSQFFWTTQTDESQLSDFFSYNKMVMVIVSAIIALLMILFRITTQSLAIKRSYAYIPMGVYSLFVILSYVFSEYKVFALWGWNDRFEGTIPLLCYMIMLFLTINSVNTEQNVKQILVPIAISVTLLSLLGISQALDQDFYRTVWGQKLLVPNLPLVAGGTTWEAIDQAAANGELYLRFTFVNKEIYQTVYNINYVSFYLTLLVPLYTMLFLREMQDKDGKLHRRIVLGLLIALMIYNLIGSQSSGGYLGIGVAFIVAIILFNKQLIKWIKPLLIVFLIVAIVMATTVGRWWPEISAAVKSVLGLNSTVNLEEESEPQTKPSAGSVAPTIDYMLTNGNTVTMSINGEELIVAAELESDTVKSLSVCDKDGKVLELIQIEDSAVHEINDDRFRNYATVAVAYDGNRYFVQITTAGHAWNFVPENGEMFFYAGTGKTVKLEKVETWGFKNNPWFGSGRGSIWAHSFPLLKHTLLWGSGADTYCAVYPQHDYARKWNENGNSAANLYLIVDKPHNMYLHAGIGTGCISLLALLALYGIYLVQSYKLYRKRDFGNDYLLFAGAGTFLGATGFMVTGMVNDSTVSVMPLFYTLLGMGIAINMIIKRRDAKGLAANSQ